MRRLDVLRHSMRQKPGHHLSQEGKALAQYVAKTLNSYEKVVTSTLPRAIETAVVMGCAVTETMEQLGAVDENIAQRINWPADLEAINAALATYPDGAVLAESQVTLWQEVAAGVTDGNAGLIITHGAILELGALVSLRKTNLPIFGPAFAYCEGVRLYFDGRSCKRVEQIRLPQHIRIVNNLS